MKVTRRGLIKVDHAKADVENADKILMVRHDHNAGKSKNDVKDVVSGSTAHQTLFLGNNKPHNAGQYQQRSEDEKDVIV